MTPLKMIGILVVLTLPLMAATCELRKGLTEICDGLSIAYAHYDAVAASGAISAGTMAKVAVVRRQTDDICANPETATTVSLTAAAARAYVALNAAFREGGSARSARLGYTQLQNLRAIAEKAKRN